LRPEAAIVAQPRADAITQKDDALALRRRPVRRAWRLGQGAQSQAALAGNPGFQPKKACSPGAAWADSY